MIDMRPITRDTIAEILPKLRPIDRLELDLMRRRPAEEELWHGASESRRSFAAYMDDDLVCIVGVKAVSVLSNVGHPWAMVTRAVDRPEVRRAFITNSASTIDWLGQGFTRLWNLVAEENAMAVRWLRWSGFAFDGRSIELSGHRLLHFERVM